MATVYDEFLGSRGNLSYVENAQMDYPLPVDITVLGTTLLPRVYGKDLQAFEIASSGIVTLTLEDVRSLDMQRDSLHSNVILSTLSNDSFEINVNDSLVTMKVDGKNNDMSFYTQRDTNLTADRNYNLTANSNIFMLAQSDVDITASNDASVNVENNLRMSSTTMSNLVGGDYDTQVFGNINVSCSNDVLVSGISMSNMFTDTITIQAGQNFVASGDNSAKMVSLGRVEVSGVENNMNIIMDDLSQTFRTHTNFQYFATASNKFEIATSNDFVLSAKDNILMQSTTMSNTMSEDYKTIVGRDMSVEVASNIDMSSITMSNVMSEDYKTIVGRDMSVAVTRDIDVSSTNATHTVSEDQTFTVGRDMITNVTRDITMTSTTMSNAMSEDYKTTVGRDMSVAVTGDLDMSSRTFSNQIDLDYHTTVGKDVLVNVASNIEITAQDGSYTLDVHGSAMKMVMDSATDGILIETVSNMDVGVSNDYTTTVQRDMITNVTRDIAMSSTTMSNVISQDYKTSVGQDMSVSVVRDLDFSSTTFSNVMSHDYKTQVGNDMIVDVASNIDFTAQTGSFDISVNNAAMTMSMDNATNTFKSHTDNDYVVTASNNTTLDTKVDFLVRSKDAANDRQHYMKFLSDNQIKFSTTGTYDFAISDGINGTPRSILGMDNSNVFVYGNLNVEGVVNSTSIFENKLEIEDKTLYLATNSNFVDSLSGPEADYDYALDGVANDGAGLKVHGFPSDAIVPEGQTKHSVEQLYEKSIRWNKRTLGVTGLGGTTPEEEARWEFRGGALYLTNKRVDTNGDLVNTTSFGFRINNRDELELIKEFHPVEGSSFIRRVAKFGFNL